MKALGIIGKCSGMVFRFLGAGLLIIGHGIMSFIGLLIALIGGSK